MLLFNRPILLLTRHYFVTNLRSTVHSIDSKFTCLRRCSQHSLQAHCRLKSPSVHMFIKDLKNIYTKQFSPLARFISRLPQRLPATTTLPAGCLATCLIFYYHASRNVECAAKHAKSRLAGRSDPSDLPDPPFDWKAFREILLPEIWYLIAAVVSALAVAVVNINIPLLMGELVDAVSKFTAQTAKSFMDEVKKPVMKLIIIYSIQAVLTFFYISLLSTLGERVALTMKKQLFASLLSQDIAFFDKHKTGELIDRLTTDIQDFKSSFKLCISQGLRSVTQTVGCVVSLLLMSVKLTGVMLIVVPAIIVGGTLLGTSLRRLSKAAQDQVAKATAVAAEAVGNVRTVRAFAMEDKENELHGQQVEEACKLNIQLGIGIGIFQGLANLALNGIVLGTIFAGGWMLSVSELTAGDLMSFLVATQTIERSLAQMSLLFGQVVRGLGAGARVFEYINTKPEIPLKGGEKMHSIQGNIEFSDVSFSYPARPDQVVLNNFSLSVPGGGVVALVGLSGGGKSTVAALLERFYDVSEGKITLDGRDIRELDPTWLRGQAIGFINQEPVLFATTVMENIRYGRPDATDDEVLKAAELANAHDFVSQFPQGYNTVLGERGVTVSGGQKQRIAIARALIKNPSILVLDEATSALDAESERVVQEALDKVIKDRTVIVIAHRLSTIRNADMIAVVSNGKIVEKGTHRVLKKKKGLYWELIRKQELEEEILVHEKHTETE